MCTDIRQVDASGTTVSIIMPTEPKVTKYEVGTPTSISLVNPTVLTPAGVVVDSYANLDSLVIKNIPSTKSYTTFDKVMNIYVIGGTIEFGVTLQNHTTLVSNSAHMNRFVTNLIPVTGGHSVTMSSNDAIAIEKYDSAGTWIDNKSQSPGVDRTITLESNCVFIRVAHDNDVKITNAKVTDNTSNTIIFEYRA
jgi:hypothetical protein